MRYSIDPRDRRHVKRYGILSFAKNIGRSINNKYSQIILDSAKKSATDAIKTASKRAIQKTTEFNLTTEATGDLLGNKIADKTANISKKSSRELHSTELHSNKANNEIPK